ncbi:phage head morphogenesis protein [Avibacterium paragallinarum]|uniref:phage head morphogenesis protein n=1 Tax=Avibacterium paragallinarum TaxID=728 RepID=UPI001CFBCCE0|nr:phage minor head protein [Avibacterium paragallinarum]WAL56325.1 phage minor head protein [Avibacterium paragallinarum]WAM58910.1 phage minor head protein [Avibacterium paragallinarum]
MTLTTIKKPKKQKRWLFPEAIEREYVKYLQAIAKQISDTARKKLPEIAPHLKRMLRQDDSIDILEQWLTELLQATTFYTRDNDIRPAVRQFLSQTAEFNKKQFHKVLKSAYKVDIFFTEPWLDEPLLQAEWQNINLIKSIPIQLQEKLRYRMAEAVLGGESYKSLAADLEKLLDIPKRRATIIARDQIGKLNGRLTQLRQENIGVKSYIWRGSLDERERLSHVEREGKVFRWDNPPDDGHPGQPILCRCSAEAVLPEFGELESVVTSTVSNNLNGFLLPTDLYFPNNHSIKNEKLMNVADKYQAAVKVEPRITEDISKIISTIGGSLAGLEYRLKSLESLERKVALEILAGLSEYQAVEKVKDIIRYTVIFDPDEFVSKYNEIQKVLGEQGYKTVVVKNTWKDNETYKGVNTFVNTVIEKDNITFEVQYHTKESFDLKNGKLHELYERFRDPNTTLEEKERLYLEMKKLSAKLTEPKNIHQIKGAK